MPPTASFDLGIRLHVNAAVIGGYEANMQSGTKVDETLNKKVSSD
jgi:hypothetical protein